MTYMTQEERQKERMAVFSTMPLQKDNQRLIIQYSSYASDDAIAEIPMEAVENKVPIKMPNGDRCYVISDATVGESEYRLSMAFSGDRKPVPPTETTHIEVVDMVEQGAAVQNIRAYIQSLSEGEEEQEKENENMEDMNTNPNEQGPAPTMEELMKQLEALKGAQGQNDNPASDEAAVTDTEMVEATEQSAPISPVEEATADMVEDWDDSVPVFSTAAEEVKAEQADDEVTVEMPKNTDSAWDGALLTGGRETSAVPWRFEAMKKPVFVYDDETGQFNRVNNAKGEPDLYALLNPTFKSDRRPAGANMGSGGVTSQYKVLQHPEWVDPILRAAEDYEGVQAKVTSWNEGAKCRLDLDVSQATQVRKLASDRMNESNHAHKFLNTDAFGEAAHTLDGLYKYGFAIQNSIDGRGAFEATAMALRVYCSNLASAGQIQSITRARHTKGVISAIDFNAFGEQMVNAVVELQNWLVNTELMSFIPVDVQLFDRLMVASETHGLMSLPTVRRNLENETEKVTGGYLWRVIGDGYTPDGHNRAHVSVDNGDKQTLFHALQCFTGAYTHKPEWNSNDGKQKMKGNIYGIDNLMKRLKTTDQMFTSVATSALSAAKDAFGRPLTLSDKDEVKSFIHAHPEVLKVAVKDGRGSKLLTLQDLPNMETRIGLHTA